MATNIYPYMDEVDMRQEMMDLFSGGEFVPKWQPYVMRKSRKDISGNKIKCSCYDVVRNEGKSDCSLCGAVGFLWDESILPGYRWSPRNVLMSAQNSYKSYGGRSGRLYDTPFILIVPFPIDVTVGDPIYEPRADADGGILFPIVKEQEFIISDKLNAVFDFGKKDFTSIGITIK